MARIKIIFIGTLMILSACSGKWTNNEAKIENTAPASIVLYDWEDDIPMSLLDAFTLETGIKVKYVAYESDVEADMNMFYRNGDFDVVVVDNDAIPSLRDQNLLSELDYENLPNFKYVSINFRDLVYDADNKYSVPFNWGTTGLIYVESEEFAAPESWVDLWNYPETVKIGLREDLPYDNLAIAKKVLGVSINECDSDVLDQAKLKLMELKSNIVLVSADSEKAIDVLESRDIDILMGWADDVFEASDRGLEVRYILPKEGTMLWGDSFVVPLRSHHKKEAEAFINYVLLPENAAVILEYNNYASVIDSVRDILPVDIQTNSIIFPSDESMLLSEIYLPVSDACNNEQIRIWREIISEIK